MSTFGKPPGPRDPLDELRESRRRHPQPSPAAAGGPADAQAEARSVLADVAVSFASALDLTDILNKVVDGILRVTGCERGCVMLRGGDGEFTTYTGRYADQREWDETDARAISHSVTNRVAETRELFASSDLRQLDDFRSNKSIQAGGIVAAVCLPLLYKDALIGVIYADSKHMIPRSLDESHQVLLAIGGQASFAIESARSRGKLKARAERAGRQPSEYRMGRMVSRDPAMEVVFAAVEKIARTGITVLIQGESGTGKDLLAQAIHLNSPRAGKPFIPVNAGGMLDELVSSILFGHKKGAFTGAFEDRPGLFDRAEGGTLFLDEIGEMPLLTQPKLLRVLENREMSRVGEEGVVRRVDVRIIAATNRDLAAAVASGGFREDLFNRLRGAPIYLPPLRDRPEDIIPLAKHFIARYAEEHNMATPELARDARARLLANPWVGNARALKNVIELSIAFRDEHNVIHADAIDRYFLGLVPSGKPAVEAWGLREEMERHEAEFVRRALGDHDGNVSKTAAALGISRQQLHAKINKYKIIADDE